MVLEGRWKLTMCTGSGVGALAQLLATQTSSFDDFQLPSADPAANALHILSLIRCACS